METAQARTLAEIEALPDDAIVSREEIGVMVGSERPPGQKHLTVNQWVWRHRPGGMLPTFPKAYTVAGTLQAHHRLGDIRVWLRDSGRIFDDSIWYTNQQVMDRLDIQIATLKAWQLQGRFPRPTLRRGKSPLWKRDVVEAWIERHEAGPVTSNAG